MLIVSFSQYTARPVTALRVGLLATLHGGQVTFLNVFLLAGMAILLPRRL